MEDDSNEDRQENEKAALKAIYNEQMVDVTRVENEWEPLECILTLYPQLTCGPVHRSCTKLDLHVTCTSQYPNEVPLIELEKCKGVSNENLKVLLKELQDLSKSLVGEVMIFQLAQHVEMFLDKYTEPGYSSFYEEMVSRKRCQEQKALLQMQEDEQRKREEILLEIQVRQQAVKAEQKALRRRRSSVRTEDQGDGPDPCRNSPKHRTPSEGESTEQKSVQDPEEYKPWNFSGKGNSRFENEFEHIKWLGKGAFGDVIKVRNILDDGLYAVKRIKLNPKNIQLNKKITREVKLLSRLNHENVVRYYNSWIESALVESTSIPEKKESTESDNVHNKFVAMLPRKEPSLDWNTKPSEVSEDSSSEDCWIQFKTNSEGDEVDAPILSSTESYTNDQESSNTIQYMYIQMELCEKSTLRSTIDEGLHSDVPRVWRLFREVVEGLCHIHQQGIIHRDLKPVNIFIDNDDHVKIGDFGLATTSILHKQSREYALPNESSDRLDAQTSFNSTSLATTDLSQTSQIGTVLYVAPELKSKIAKIPYNQKVDIFSLGIIFFEMCHPPLQTGMERYKIINDLRQKEPSFPSDFRYGPDSPQQSLIRLMMKHDARERPTSEQLLQSDFIPPPEFEEAKVRELVRHTISNPQSKDYKHLVESCFRQVISPGVDATYSQMSGRPAWFLLSLESVTEKLRKIFVRHGAMSLLTPLLTPAVQPPESCVCLMTRGGGIVYATYDLKLSFARFLAHNPTVTHMRRYAFDKVFREKRVHGLHPKEMYECAFDIVTPTGMDDLMAECEIINVLWEILHEFPSLLSKNCFLQLNHTSLIFAALKQCGINVEKRKGICLEIFKFKNDHDESKSEFESVLKSLGLTDHTIAYLSSMMSVEGSLKDIRLYLGPILKDPKVGASCEQAFQQLEKIIASCEALGISSRCPVVVKLGLTLNAHFYSGLIFQFVTDARSKPKQTPLNVVATGGRYDYLVHSYRKSLAVVGESNQGVAGFNLSLDKLINSLSDQGSPPIVDVLVCSLGQSQMTSDKLLLLRDLWKSGIRTSFSSSLQRLEDIKSYCSDMNIPNIVTLKDTEPGVARLSSWNKERFLEKKLPYNDLIDQLHRILKTGSTEPPQPKIETRSSHSSTEGPVIHFIGKPTPVVKRRYVNQILTCLSSTLQKFASRTRVEIIAVNMEKEVLKKVWYCYESDNKDHEIGNLKEAYPRHKKPIAEIVELIEDSKKNDHSLVIILYSLADNTFKALL